MPILNSVLMGSDTSDATALAEDVLSNKTAYVDGEKIVGTMTNNGAQTASLNAGDSYTIPQGYHNGSGVITANSLGSETPGTAIASDILSGETAWVNGTKITGTMVNQGAKTASLNADQSYTIPEGYHNGSGKVTAKSLASQTTGTAIASEILKDSTAWVNGNEITGTMPDQGAKTASLNAGESYTIPAGYHNGSGTVIANSLVSQTDGTAEAKDIVEGKTAWVDGVKQTGTLILPGPGVVTTRTAELPDQAYWSSVCYGDNKFVAVSYEIDTPTDYYPTYSSNVVAYSEDGITWTKTTLPSSSQAGWKSVCYGNGKYVAISGTYFYGDSSAEPSRMIIYSEDGVTWTDTSFPSRADWSSICYGNGKFVAVALAKGMGITDVVAYSTNGVDWTETTLPSSASWASVCYGNGKFVAITINNDKAAYSEDGVTWTATTLPSSANWSSVCYGNGKFVVIAGNGNKAAHSTDGITWTAITLPGNTDWSSICYGNGNFVAIAYNSNAAAYSIDGINWIGTSLPSSASWKSVCYGNGKFIAIDYNGACAILESINMNWGTASQENVLENITFTSNEGFTLSGKMTNNGKVSQQLNAGESYTIPAGYHNGSGKVTANSLADQTSSTAEAINILDGKTAYVNGSKVTGTMTNQGAKTASLNAGGSYTIPAGYHNGSGKVTANSLADQTPATATASDILNGETAWVNGSKITGTMTVSAPAEPGIKDVTESTLPNETGWIKVCYGGGKFVAIQSTTPWSTAYSEDGINWTAGTFEYESTTPLMQHFAADICYGNGMFAICGLYGKSREPESIFFSKDGINWDSTTLKLTSSSLENSMRICYGAGKFVVIFRKSNTTVINYSENASSWTGIELPVFAEWTSICYGNGKFVALAQNSNYVIYSEDSINWTTAATLPTSSSWQNICYGNGKFIALANDDGGTIAYSADGINWISGASLGLKCNSICYDNGLFIVTTSTGGIVAYSKDGINWTKETLLKDANWISVCYGDKKFVAISNRNNAVSVITPNMPPNDINWGTARPEDVPEGVTFTSNEGFTLDGTMIAPIPAEPGIVDVKSVTLPSSPAWSSVCYGNGKFVAIAYNNNTIAYSVDGISWRSQSISTFQNWTSICYGNGVFVAISSGEAVIYSMDGLGWIYYKLPSYENWASVCYGNGKFVAIAKNSNKAIYSTDGITWTATNLPYTANWESVCYGNGRFVAVGSHNRNTPAAYSNNGINWISASIDTFTFWSSVCYGNGKFVAVASSTDNSTPFAYSTNGSTWIYPESSLGTESWSSVCYGNGLFVAVAYNSDKIAYSLDGITWTEATLPSSVQWQSVCYGDGKFVIVADNNKGKAAILTTRMPPDYTDWGSARPEDVLEGVTFTSDKGFTLGGTMVMPEPHVILTVKCNVNELNNDKFLYVPLPESYGSLSLDDWDITCSTLYINGYTYDTSCGWAPDNANTLAIKATSGVLDGNFSGDIQIVLTKKSQINGTNYFNTEISDTVLNSGTFYDSIGAAITTILRKDIALFMPFFEEAMRPIEELPFEYFSEPEKTAEVITAYFEQIGQMNVLEEMITDNPYVNDAGDLMVLPLMEPYAWITVSPEFLAEYSMSTEITFTINLSILAGGIFDRFAQMSQEASFIMALILDSAYGSIYAVPCKYNDNGTLSITFGNGEELHLGTIVAFICDVASYGSWEEPSQPPQE